MPDAKSPALLPGFSYCCDVAVRDKLLAHLKKAIRVAAESSPGVCAVNDHLIMQKTQGWM
jgi:hypothetical protein